MVQIDDLWLWVYVYSQHDQLFEPPGEQALIIRPTILLGGDTGFFKKNQLHRHQQVRFKHHLRPPNSMLKYMTMGDTCY